MHAIIETSTYLADAKSAGLSDDNRAAVIATIAADPSSGALMQGTGGARKLRFAYPGRGKSGSFRTVHYFGGNDVPVFLLAVIQKNERANLNDAEKNALRKELATIADNYRQSVKALAKRKRK